MNTLDAGVTLSAGLVIALIMQMLKPLVEKAIPAGDPLHDPLIQMLAGVVGVLGFVAHQATLAPLTGATVWDNAAQGFMAGIAAIATYHVLGNVSTTLIQGGSTGPVNLPSVWGYPAGTTVTPPLSLGSLSGTFGPTATVLQPATIQKAEVVTPTPTAPVEAAVAPTPEGV